LIALKEQRFTLLILHLVNSVKREVLSQLYLFEQQAEVCQKAVEIVPEDTVTATLRA
jgi:hypothetical protein